MRGYTLLEMILTLAVLTTIIMALAMRLSIISERLAVRTEAAAARLFLESSYGYALASQQTIRVQINPNSMISYLVDGTQLALHPVRQGVALAPASNHRTELALYPTLSASPASLSFSKGGASCSLVVSLRGRFRIT
jgi:prepilin-type N-terminal cleavage/methylation domain-containing protein